MVLPSPSKSTNETEENTVIGHLRYLYPNHSLRRPPNWPPDLFALAGSLLSNSGAYIQAMVRWPPRASWRNGIGRIAADWRRRWNRKEQPPTEVQSLWRELLKHADTQLNHVSESRDLSVALLELCAIADEASFSLGIPPSQSSEFDNFYIHAAELLANESGATLCEKIHESKARVLPKMHTPQTGLTFRSFSIHLALYRVNEMVPNWVTVASHPEKHMLRLLLLPWPLTIKRDWFQSVPGGISMPKEYGFFEYSPEDTGVEKRTREAVDRAIRKFRRIDGVVFPELALTQGQYVRVSQIVLSRSAFLIAGVGSAGKMASGMNNRIHFDLPLPPGFHAVRLRQGKHHRWRLDKSQIHRYKLESRLGGKKFLWEHIELEDRCLNFVTLRPWLTISVLICEDLARPDPVGDLVRAVGPNLVIALLLDGPQLKHRWASRHAAALSDDPGSSVLTLTSVGMAKLSCPRGKRDEGYGVVALWKDGGSGESKPIRVKKNYEGIVLDINVKEKTEYCADGRSDYGATGYPLLTGIHFI